MHVALMVDDERLQNEQAMLNRLSIGLIDEGAQVTRLVPEQPAGEPVEKDELLMALANRVVMPMRVLPGMRHVRAQRLAEQLQRSVPDVLYAVGEQARRIAMDLGAELDRPVVVDVWSMAQVRELARSRWARTVAGMVAATEPLAQALRSSFEADLVHQVPWGVSLPARQRAMLAEASSAVSLVITGSGRDLPGYRNMLGGLAAVVAQAPQLMAFLELRGDNEHELWRTVRRMHLESQISALTNASQHRPLVTRCDALLLPERLGEMRSLTLEAMAAGMPVIAADDPARDMLKSEDTAIIIVGSGPDPWAAALRRLFDDRDRIRSIGLRGRELVAHRFRSSDQARNLLAVLEGIIRAGTLAFPAASS